MVIVLSRTGRSETQLAKALETIGESGFERLAEHWPQRDGFQSDLRAGRETRSPYLREVAEKVEEAIFARIGAATPR